VEARAHRAYRRADGMGDLFDGEVAVIAKDDGDAVVDAEPAEGALERIALDDGAMGVIRGSRASRSIQILVASVSASAKVVTAGVDQDPAEPGLEPIGISKSPVVPPCANERVVGRIFSLLCVAEDEKGEPIRLVEVRPAQPLEGDRSISLDAGVPEGVCLVAQTVLRCGMVPLLSPLLTHEVGGTFTEEDDTPGVVGGVVAARGRPRRSRRGRTPAAR